MDGVCVSEILRGEILCELVAERRLSEYCFRWEKWRYWHMSDNRKRKQWQRRRYVVAG